MNEPLKGKTFMDDYDNFPLLISHFADFDKRRKKSFSYTNDIKSAVEWLREEISKLSQSENIINKLDTITLINKAFEDVTSNSASKKRGEK